MNDVDRVKGFGKTLKAFQAVADQINEIADLQATEKEAKRLTEDALQEMHKAEDDLKEQKLRVLEACSLRAEAYQERDKADKLSKEAACAATVTVTDESNPCTMYAGADKDAPVGTKLQVMLPTFCVYLRNTSKVYA